MITVIVMVLNSQLGVFCRMPCSMPDVLPLRGDLTENSKDDDDNDSAANKELPKHAFSYST